MILSTFVNRHTTNLKTVFTKAYKRIKAYIRLIKFRHNQQRKKLNQNSKAKLLNRLSLLLEQGYSFMQALDILKGSSNTKEKYTIDTLYYHLQKGKPMAFAFQKAHFSNQVSALVSQSEGHGQLCQAIKRASEWKERKIKIKKEIQKAVSYPIILMLVLLLIGYIVFYLVIPHFVTMFEAFSIELPKSTLFMLSLISMMNRVDSTLIVVVILSTLVATLLFKKESTRVACVKKLLTIPKLKFIPQTLMTISFCTQLGYLLYANIPLYKSIHQLKTSSQSAYLKNYIQQMEQSLLSGQPLCDVIAQSQCFNSELNTVIYYAEKNGQLAEQLIQYGFYLEKTLLDRWIERIKWIEPILLLLIGSLIVYLFVAMFSPIMSLIENI